MSSTPATPSNRYDLAITTPNGSTDDRSVTIEGLLTDGTGAPVSGKTVEVDEGGTSLGTASVGADGRWSAQVLLQDLGANTLTAQTAGSATGGVTSAPVVLTLDTVLSPSSTNPQGYTRAKLISPTHNAEVSGDGGATTFVFRPHPGHAVIDDFGLSGAGADCISLPHSSFCTFADVLRHTTMANGDAIIHLSPRDSITLVGVSKAELRADAGAVMFHG